MEICYEFIEEKDFPSDATNSVLSWLEHMVVTRKHIEFDCLQDFVNEFAEFLACLMVEEATDHYAGPLLPEPNEAFDPNDDSIYNDQND